MQTDPRYLENVDPQELMVFRHLGARLPYINVLRQFEVRLARVELQSRISIAMSRAAAAASRRLIDPLLPLTWEFAGFSQHGEDGILDYLCDRVLKPNRFFFEIGAADGIQNNTAWLAFARGYGGVWVDGDPALCAHARLAIEGMMWNVFVIDSFVDLESVATLLKMCPHRQPDVFSLDIDGIDFHIARRVFELGVRPKIWVVEYNSVFGPDQAVSVPYARDFNRWSSDPSGLYYGCSVNGWRRLFCSQGYTFVTVESSGCNAFFIDPAAFPSDFARKLRGEVFRNNDGDLNAATRPVRDTDGHNVLPLRDWREQYPRIRLLPVVEIE